MAKDKLCVFVEESNGSGYSIILYSDSSNFSYFGRTAGGGGEVAQRMKYRKPEWRKVEVWTSQRAS